VNAMNAPDNRQIVEHQKRLWERKLQDHGDLPQAVGSESLAHKNLRYRLLSDVFMGDAGFSLLDVGAGVGDYFGYIQRECSGQRIAYHATEITPEFCRAAKERYPGISIRASNILEEDIGSYDYVVMSGIFHQRGEVPLNDWCSFMASMLGRAFEICRKGIGFNVLSHHVEFRREDNYYVDLAELQEWIVRKLSRFYTLNQAYPLFEATMAVYKPAAVRAVFPQEEFARYIKPQERP
jgi:hypothetical protein